MTLKPAPQLAIFRAGTHVAEDGQQYTFSEADIQAIAAGYNPAVFEAPLVVGHPKTDDPAYGWVQKLSARDGVLYAQPHQVEPAFAESVNAGRHKKISASIYLATTPGNPTPGKPYLRHVGFLGAAAPGVKGLPVVQFADGDDAPTFAESIVGFGWTLADIFQRLRDFLIEREGMGVADRLIPQWQVRDFERIGTDTQDNTAAAAPLASFAELPNDPEITMSQSQSQTQTSAANVAEREQRLTEQTAAIQAREQALAAREATARRQDAAAFAEGLVSAGRLLPRQSAPVVELLLALPSAPLNFTEGEAQVQRAPADVLRTLLAELPVQVNFAEKSAGGDAPAAVSFAAPAGTQVPADRAELFALAKAHQTQHPGTSWAAAVAAVGG